MTASDLMVQLLQIIHRAPWPMYVLIDEHDNFANDLIARGRSSTYEKILGASGFVRDFYKCIKAGADSGTIHRMFITGVSPLMINDMTSGFNIAKSISQEDDFHDLCGFPEEDVARLLDGAISDRGLRLDRQRVLDDLRRYYDGYRFTPGATTRLYNPDMVLHFISRSCGWRQRHQPPSAVRTGPRWWPAVAPSPGPAPVANPCGVIADRRAAAPGYSVNCQCWSG